MSDSKETNNVFPVGLVTLLTVVFAAAKVFGFTDMSWWWVFSPIWIAWGLVLAILALIIIIGLIIAVFAS